MPENVQKIIKYILRDIQVELTDEFDRNFERQAFFSEKWQRRKSPARNQGRAILTDTGRLRRSIQSRVADAHIEFFSTEPYAAIHNEGGEIVVTDRMKRFFRAKAYEAAGTFGRRSKKHPPRPSRREGVLRGQGAGGKGPLSDRQFWGWMHTAPLTPEAEFWCALAMKPAGSTIKIPRRRFLGTSPEVEKAVREIIDENITDLGQDWHSGIDYHEPPFSDWLIEVGQPDSLGLYLKAATQTIPKKNALAFWDTFAEIFGMPMRIARTTTRDDKELAKMEKMMNDMGTEGWGIFQQGTDIEVVESTKGDAFNVYDRRIERANSELSKLIIGQTMTLEDGSSLSQSQTHLEVFQNIIEADCDMLRDMVNNQLIPRMIRHGFPLAGIRFDWDYSTDYTPEQQVAYEQLVLNNYEVDAAYFEEKYNMPVGERRGNPPPALPKGGSEKGARGKEVRTHPGPPQGREPRRPNDQHPFFD